VLLHTKLLGRCSKVQRSSAAAAAGMGRLPRGIMTKPACSELRSGFDLL
jgi:hypothetical protein